MRQTRPDVSCCNHGLRSECIRQHSCTSSLQRRSGKWFRAPPANSLKLCSHANGQNNQTAQKWVRNHALKYFCMSETIVYRGKEPRDPCEALSLARHQAATRTSNPAMKSLWRNPTKTVQKRKQRTSQAHDFFGFPTRLKKQHGVQKKYLRH